MPSRCCTSGLIGSEQLRFKIGDPRSDIRTAPRGVLRTSTNTFTVVFVLASICFWVAAMQSWLHVRLHSWPAMMGAGLKYKHHAHNWKSQYMLSQGPQAAQKPLRLSCIFRSKAQGTPPAGRVPAPPSWLHDVMGPSAVAINGIPQWTQPLTAA